METNSVYKLLQTPSLYMEISGTNIAQFEVLLTLFLSNSDNEWCWSLLFIISVKMGRLRITPLFSSERLSGISRNRLLSVECLTSWMLMIMLCCSWKGWLLYPFAGFNFISYTLRCSYPFVQVFVIVFIFLIILKYFYFH